MTLTKAQIVEELFAENIFTKTESTRIIEILFELIKQSLQNRELEQEKVSVWWWLTAAIRAA